MSTLILATTATDNPMGAQRYQREVIAGALTVLPGWRVRESVARSLRSPWPGNRRLPMGWLVGASVRARQAVGALTYPGCPIVHRMDLVLPPGAGPNVVTIHDVVAWRYPDESPSIAAAPEEARRADAVICVSHFSAGEAESLLGVRNARVIYNGVDEVFFSAEPLSAEWLQHLDLRSPYVLHAGGAAKRKNLEALAEAWPRIHQARPGLTLALCGPAHPRRTELFKDLRAVRLLGRQPEELLPRLVAGAELVVVPSTYEGFGLPALEAMAAGVPVVAANTSALPEVVGDAGLLVEPTANGVVDGVLDAVSLGSEAAPMIRRGRERASWFTWSRCVDEHAAVWRSVA